MHFIMPVGRLMNFPTMCRTLMKAYRRVVIKLPAEKGLGVDWRAVWMKNVGVERGHWQGRETGTRKHGRERLKVRPLEQTIRSRSICCLAQCLIHNRCSISICWRKDEWWLGRKNIAPAGPMESYFGPMLFYSLLDLSHHNVFLTLGYC